MTNREAKMQTHFNRWLKYNVDRPEFELGGKFELKASANGKSIPFNAVQNHQLENLLARYTIYKIEDGTRSPKPFDSFLLKSPGFIPVTFDGRKIYIFEVKKFVELMEGSERKSLTEEEAFKHCKIYDEFK